MDQHPGIVIRPGPTGPRAALVAGPDVSEIISAIHASRLSSDEAIAVTAYWGNLSVDEVR